MDIEDCAARCTALYRSGPTDDLDFQPGLFGHLADHCMMVGLAGPHPAAGY